MISQLFKQESNDRKCRLSGVGACHVLSEEAFIVSSSLGRDGGVLKNDFLTILPRDLEFIWKWSDTSIKSLSFKGHPYFQYVSLIC